MSNPFAMPNRSNIQGLILRGYTHPFSCHLLFSFSNVDKILVNTKSFFNDLYPKVQSAADWGNNKPASMLNIGLTYNGISQLNNIVQPVDLANFPPTFVQGPWSLSGAQASLLDIADPLSTPSNWWNGNGDAVNQNLHCVVHAYALTNDELGVLVDFITASAAKNGLSEIIPLAVKNGDGRLYQSIVEDNPAKIHFGYTDGISEPALGVPGRAGGIANTEDYSNFLIGYSNGSVSQPGPFDTTTAGVFAKDGCYNAFRILYQDEATFNQFLKDQAAEWKEELAYLGLTEKELEEWFAAKLCGRWRNGSPLMLSPDKPGDDDNTASTGEAFGYAVLDNPDTVSTDLANDIPSSMSCPFSGHTRVANPRNQNLITSMEGTNGPPRIIRRGMPYGASLTSNTDDGVDRGLIGLFLCGDLAGQFEKLYGWMNNNNFSDTPIFSIGQPPQDALLGNRKATGNDYSGVVKSFIIPIKGGSITIPELPQFLATRGTAYCLLPSLESLAKIAGR